MQYFKFCFCFRRMFRLGVAEPPREIKDLFRRYSSENGTMSIDNLHAFLVEVQGEEDSSKERAQAIFDSLKHQPFQRKGLNIEAFFCYLFGDLNGPLPGKVHQDMTASLSHYFIYTGHNSYLTGNQLNSDCSDVPIIMALNRGVRVVELDTWPNSTKDDVLVKHGRTLTTPVELIKCLKSIKEHAFSASPYPVIITLEDHLTPDLQDKVAQMITQTFGDMLFCPDSETFKELPSPEDLKYKIIISTKPPTEYLKAKTVKEDSKESQKPKDSDEDEWGKEPADVTKDQDENDTSDLDASEQSVTYEPNYDTAPELCSSAALSYKSLNAIHAGKPKGNLKEALKAEDDKVRRLSLSEQKLEKAAESHGTEVVRFTQKNFLRVYPKGTRFSSSNYKPLVGWMHGAQMVAFNMQGYGRNLWLMHGMFRSNGGCGYVKKPEFLLKKDEIFNPKSEKREKKRTLKVKVYVGDGWLTEFKQTHFDFFSPPDFYVRVGIAGVPAEKIMKRTKTIEDNWIPAWDDNNEFIFPLTVPELALLRVEVHEYDMSEKDDFAGQTCLPVAELKQGIRAVPLYDRKGDKYKSIRLLMRFEFI